MITIGNRLVAKKRIEDVYALFSDMQTLTSCVPQCRATRIIDDTHFEADLQLRLGIIPLENKLHMEVSERQRPSRIVTEGWGEAGAGLARAAKLADSQMETRLRICFDLEARDEESTVVACRIEVEAAGNLKRVYEGIIIGQRAKLEASFVDNVRRALDCPVEIIDTEFQSDARKASPASA